MELVLQRTYWLLNSTLLTFCILCMQHRHAHQKGHCLYLICDWKLLYTDDPQWQTPFCGHHMTAFSKFRVFILSTSYFISFTTVQLHYKNLNLFYSPFYLLNLSFHHDPGRCPLFAKVTQIQPETENLPCLHPLYVCSTYQYSIVVLSFFCWTLYHKIFCS